MEYSISLTGKNLTRSGTHTASNFDKDEFFKPGILPKYSSMIADLDISMDESAVSACATALMCHSTFCHLRTALMDLDHKRPIERTLSHPVTFQMIDTMKEYNLIPPELVWKKEPLTSCATPCIQLAAKTLAVTKSGHKDSPSDSDSDSPNDSYSDSSEGKDARQARHPDGLFYLPATLPASRHTLECAQRTAKVSVELKNRINIDTEVNLNLARYGAQRDFAFTSPAGGCHFTLSGDGLCFVFLRTHVEHTKVQTTVSSLYCIKEMEGLTSFLTDFAKVLRASVGRSPEAAFVHAPYKPEELQVGSYQFVRPLAVNENTVVAQLHKDWRTVGS